MRPAWHAAKQEAAAIDAARQQGEQNMATWQRHMDEIERLRLAYQVELAKAQVAIAEAQSMDQWAMATATSAIVAAKQAKNAWETAVARLRVRAERAYGQETAIATHGGQTG